MDDIRLRVGTTLHNRVILETVINGTRRSVTLDRDVAIELHRQLTNALHSTASDMVNTQH